jgi:limonene-1,2-epoxide hydrolase
VDIEIRAARSSALLNNEHFVATMQELRERQKDVFANSAASDVEGREEAHAIIRALNAIEASLKGDVDAVTILKKRKEQHRGND